MVISIILIGALLVVTILAIVYRIHSLVDIARGTHKKRASGSNRFNAIMLFLFLLAGVTTMVWLSFSWFDDYHLPVASEHGKATDSLFWITIAVTLIVFFITQILLFYFSFRYRYKEKGEALYYPENNRLEIIWTLIPAVVLALLIFGGLKVWNNIMDDPPQEAEVVEIMGYQFAWRTRYPGNDNQLGAYDFRLVDAVNEFGMDFRDRASFDDFTPREIHLPKGKPVLFKIRSRDVLHSVFAPHFRLKMDAVPGMPTRFWFVPDKSTAEMRQETGNPDFNFEIACAELCGRGHFSMRMLVVVEEPEEYEKWKAEQEPWLSKNPEYLTKVPEDLRELALLKTGLNKPE